ncbi:hypothetical protein TNCV_5008851 [Trichonephila clavipes]|nr:hypothetical protein TNCV_5008851 [Trichonephila clavipes]
MDFSHLSPLSTTSNGTAPTPCDELTAMKGYIRRLQIICNEKEKTVSLLRLDPGHVESDSLYQLAWSEYQDIQGTLQQAVSDFDSLSPCTNPGCSHQISPKNSPNNTPPPSPSRRNLQQKRKDEDNFEFPPLRKTARKMVLESSDDIPVVNQFSLLPNVIIKQVLRKQVDTVKRIFPTPQIKNYWKYIKLYPNTTEQNRLVRQTLIGLGYKFYVITPKNERPIKVVIKGYPKTADLNILSPDLRKKDSYPKG